MQSSNFPRDINDDDIENDIREAFRCFDKDGLGYIPVPSENTKWYILFPKFHLAELTHILESLGDKLAPVETQVRTSRRILFIFVSRS